MRRASDNDRAADKYGGKQDRKEYKQMISNVKTTNDLAFKIRDLNLHYGDFHALKDIDIDIPRHKVTALIGPSGCGKSTFLRTLDRMQDTVEGAKVEGKILFDGEDIYSKECDVTDLRKKVGMVFQSPNPFPKTIYENLVYGPKVHGITDKKRLDEIVERTLKGGTLGRDEGQAAHVGARDVRRSAAETLHREVPCGSRR